jgi:hypothetical protein
MKFVLYPVSSIPALSVAGYVCIVDVCTEPVFVSMGLIYGTAGATLALASDLHFLKELFVPKEKISQLKAARDILYDDRIIQTGDQGYNELLVFVSDYFDVSENPDCISTISSPGVQKTSKNISVYGYVKREGKFPDNILEMDGYKSELSGDDYERFLITQLSLFDARFSQYIVEFEQKAVQFPLRLGCFLLDIGFVLQLVPTIIELGISIC